MRVVMCDVSYCERAVKLLTVNVHSFALQAITFAPWLSYWNSCNFHVASFSGLQ